MKSLPLVVVLVVVTATLGVGVAPLSAETGSHNQVETVDAEPPDGTQLYAIQSHDMGSHVTQSTATQSTQSLQSVAAGDGGVINTLAVPTEALERSDVRRQYADIGPAAGFDTGVTTDRLATRTIEAELDAADSDNEQLAQIDDELTELETQIIELEDDQQRTIRAFSDGTIEPQELIETVATIHLKAGTYRERMTMLKEYAEEIDADALSDDRLQRIEYDLRMLESPLRAHAVSVLRAEQPANRIMIETGNDELAVAAIEDGTYIREVNRQGLRGSGTATLSDDQPEQIIQQQYPILWNRSTSWSSDGIGSVFMMSVNYPGGELRTFIDGVSEQTFIEHQRVPLTDINTGETTSKAQDGLNVTVDQTYAGGPLRVTVTDAETEEPVAATVTIGQNNRESQSVGTVDENGVVWAISPRGAFTITVLGEGTAAAFVDIDPPSPESATNSQ